MLHLLEILNKIDVLIEQVPPIQQPQRFGNKAFHTWYNKLKEVSLELTKSCLNDNLKDHAEEISYYLNESFGNSIRIDYGTGKFGLSFK